MPASVWQQFHHEKLVISKSLGGRGSIYPEELRKLAYMILKNDTDITTDVAFCKDNPQTQKYAVTFKNGKTYFCNYQSIDWLQDPSVLNPALLNITHGDRKLFDIQAVYVFKASATNYWRIRFSNGSERNYDERDLKIVTSCLSDAEAECRYAMNTATHLDFLIYNMIRKKPILAIEVDGFHHHKGGTIQAKRDKMKNHILELYNLQKRS